MKAERDQAGRAWLGTAAAGQWLLLISAVAFSTAGLFARTAPVNLWAMIFWRNLFGSAGLIGAMLLTGPSLAELRGRLGPREAAVVATSAISSISYIAAFAYTSVANVSILYATAPLITAAIAWLVRREKMSRTTLLAAIAAVAGVAVTVGGASSAGRWFGDTLALLMTVTMSIMSVLARGSALPALPTALGTALLSAAMALPLGSLLGADFSVTLHQAAWLAALGGVTMGLALPCYLLGLAHVAAGRAMLISALEMPLAPLWVWLAFGETPSRATLIGGGIVAGAIGWDLRRFYRPAA